MSNESKRIVFTFDARDLQKLEKLVELGNFSTLAEAVRVSVRNMATIEEAKHESGASVSVIKKDKDGKEIQLAME